MTPASPSATATRLPASSTRTMSALSLDSAASTVAPYSSVTTGFHVSPTFIVARLPAKRSSAAATAAVTDTGSWAVAPPAVATMAAEPGLTPFSLHRASASLHATVTMFSSVKA